jgi:thymidylate kinase
VIIPAADKEVYLNNVMVTQLPGLRALLGMAAEKLAKKDNLEVIEGRKLLLMAARRADLVLETITALVEIEARDGKDPE